MSRPKPPNRKAAASKRRRPAAKPPTEAISIVVSAPPQVPPPPSVPAPPSPAPVRYLGNIAELASALHPARVRFPANAAAALGWIAGKLGHSLPNGPAEIARLVLDARSGWRLVDDRPELSASEYGESAQRLADRGVLVVAVRTDGVTGAFSVGLVAPGGMVAATPARRSRKSASNRLGRQDGTGNPRLEQFNGQAPGEGTPFVAEEWAYRQAPAWRLQS